MSQHAAPIAGNRRDSTPGTMLPLLRELPRCTVYCPHVVTDPISNLSDEVAIIDSKPEVMCRRGQDAKRPQRTLAYVCIKQKRPDFWGVRARSNPLYI
jgi:hypothetical protein